MAKMPPMLLARLALALALASPAYAKVCDVTKAPYHAIGDGATLNTKALQAAIDDCAGTAEAPGTVLFPAKPGSLKGNGNKTTAFVSGALFLRSHLSLEIAEGAALRGSATLKDNATWPWVYKRIAGFMHFGHASLLNGGVCQKMRADCPDGCPGKNLGDTCAEWSKLENVSLRGGGTIDGDGESWHHPPYVNVRPVLLNLMWIDGLVIEDLLVTRPPFWTIHPVFCNNVVLRNTTVDTVGYANGDGIDVDSCSNTLIENCTFSTGDDCIALKSGMDSDGRAVGIPTINVTVRDTTFLEGHGCSIGSDMSGGVANAVFENLRFKGTGTGVRIKDQRGRGGYVRNITYRNAVMEKVKAVLQITQFYHSGIPPTNATATPTFEDFLVQNITATDSECGIVMCLPEWPCHGIRFEGVHVSGSAKGFDVANAYGTTKDVTPPLKLLSGSPPPIPPPEPSPAGVVDLALFVADTEGYNTFRIPAIVQTRQEGVVLAFAEGRKLSSADHGWNDIVMKRSTDNGHSWSNLSVVHGESTTKNHVVIGNPAPIVDMASGRIHMIFSRNNAEVGVLHSDDNGKTWSAVTELTDTLMKPTNLSTIFTGLSAGFTLDPSFGHGNRLLVCSNHNQPVDPKHAKERNAGRYSSTIFSDDAGVTWQMGESVGPPGSTECNLASSREGVFMYTRMWNQGKGDLKTYGIAGPSGDGGKTFPKEGFTSMGMDWPQPDCQGTMRKVASGTGAECWALTAPFGTERANMTLSYSCGYSPGGTKPDLSWQQDRVLWAGPAGYSAMDTSRDGLTYFILYERGNKDPYETLHLTQVLAPQWNQHVAKALKTDDIERTIAAHTVSDPAQHASFVRQLFEKHAREYVALANASQAYVNGNDLMWRNNPKAWHQQTARTIDHQFTSLKELAAFAKAAKRAGVSTLMLEKINKMDACPGPWYGGLQMCEHINGTFPAADGSLEEWQAMLSDIRPMRLMWWWNPVYWSVQGPVWKAAAKDPLSDEGRFFSWNATDDDVCDGFNPCRSPEFCEETNETCHGVGCAQGSWQSDGAFTGVKSAMSSFGSPAYADYLVGAMADSWTKNLGIDGYCTDCSGDYNPTGDHINPAFGRSGCPNGMLQTNGDSLKSLSEIVDRVREKEPQVVMSGEFYGSWDEIIHAHADVGGQGYKSYHTALQEAVFKGDVSDIEAYAANSGADAATVLCYTNPYYDGQQPGACPTMYFRDQTATIEDVKKHEFWVALEAGSGVVSQHDGQPGAFWNVTIDPAPQGEGDSPLWAFHKFRALNRLALRTKLNITSSTGALEEGEPPLAVTPAGYTAYPHLNCDLYDGGIPLGLKPIHGVTADQCTAACDRDGQCDCVAYIDHGGGQSHCSKFMKCNPALFLNNSATVDFTVFVKKTPPKGGTCCGGALAYLKHDSMGPKGDAAILVYNPGKAQKITIDLSMLPSSVFGAVPVDLFDNDGVADAAPPPLAESWSVEMGAGEVKAFSGFTLGVFAPRLGKKASCKPDDGYSKHAAGTTLQECFLECAMDKQCENVFVEYMDVVWLEKPPAANCTLLGAVKDPSSGCAVGNGTLVASLPCARSCAEKWEEVGQASPVAVGAQAPSAGPHCDE